MIKTMHRFFCLCAVLVLLNACASLERSQERIEIDPQEKPISAGLATAQFDSYMGAKLRKHDIRVFYYPNDDVICLRYRANMMGYYHFWSAKNRAAFTEALDKYKVDYERRELQNKSNARTKRAYGTVRGYLWWETAEFFHRSYSYPQYELGYYFRDNNPYFAVTTREAPNEDKTVQNKTSANQVMYLTRAQADMLAQLFAQDYLNNLRYPSGRNTQVEIDDYSENDYADYADEEAYTEKEF